MSTTRGPWFAVATAMVGWLMACAGEPHHGTVDGAQSPPNPHPTASTQVSSLDSSTANALPRSSVANGATSAPATASGSIAVSALKSPKALIEEGGTFMFSWDDSPDAKKTAVERCTTDAKGDQKKADACIKEMLESSADEGIRFEKDAKGVHWWVSFGKEKGKELLFYKTAITIDKEEGRRVFISPVGSAEGLVAAKMKIPEAKDRYFEFPDNDTVQMAKPPESKKGVLTYRRKKLLGPSKATADTFALNQREVSTCRTFALQANYDNRFSGVWHPNARPNQSASGAGWLPVDVWSDFCPGSVHVRPE